MPQNAKGFTLVELSIVLVIIGLLVGGVMVGQELIGAAGRRSIISEQEKLVTAIHTFRSKYNYLPGDFPRATSVWGTDPGGCPSTAYNTTKKTTTCDGNGDGAIGGFYVRGTCATVNGTPLREIHRFWQHLANAELITGQYTGATGGGSNGYAQTMDVNAPLLKYGGGSVGISTLGHFDCVYVDASYFATYYGLLFYVGTQQVGEVTNWTFISPMEVSDIDNKVDDGKPGYGRVMVHTSTLHPNCASSNVAATATYMTTQTGKNCSLLFNERM